MTTKPEDKEEVEDMIHYNVDKQNFNDALNKQWFDFYNEVKDENQVKGDLHPKQTVTTVWNTKIKK